jgi:hypothetical protein
MGAPQWWCVLVCLWYTACVPGSGLHVGVWDAVCYAVRPTPGHRGCHRPSLHLLHNCLRHCRAPGSSLSPLVSVVLGVGTDHSGCTNHRFVPVPLPSPSRMAWVCLLSGLMHVALGFCGAMRASVLGLVTPFSCEVFGCLIGFIYLVSAGEELAGTWGARRKARVRLAVQLALASLCPLLPCDHTLPSWPRACALLWTPSCLGRVLP